MSEVWSKCTLKVPSELAETFAWLLAQALDHPIETQDASTMSPWHDASLMPIVASFEKAAPSNLEQLVDDICSQLNLDAISIHTESLTDSSWKEGWKRFFETQMITENLCVFPPWKTKPDVPFCIQIEPGMAFGTGTHETTQMMLKMMLKHLHGSEATDVLDVGSGSGILSIAATLFGHNVHGIEVDPVAVKNARKNCALNGCESVSMSIGTLTSSEPERPWVLVNILAKIILGMADDIDRVSCNHLLLSGFLITQRQEMVDAFPDFELLDEDTLGPWGCMLLQRHVK